MDFLDKELEKNKKYRDLIYKQLNRDKQMFIDEIRSGLGKKIIFETKENNAETKINFWEKVKKIFR